MTCSQLATELNVTPAEIIGPLRQALKGDRFNERNGFYSVLPLTVAPNIPSIVPCAVATTALPAGFTGQILAALEQRDMTSKELSVFTGIGSSRISAFCATGLCKVKSQRFPRTAKPTTTWNNGLCA